MATQAPFLIGRALNAMRAMGGPWRIAALVAVFAILGGMAGSAPVQPLQFGTGDLERLLAGREVTFFEDFNELRLATSHGGGVWTPRYGYGGPDDLASRTLPNNAEQQIYVDPNFRGTAERPLGLNPFSIEEGVLRITASPAPNDGEALWGYPYVSGLLTTRDRFSQQYGYFEIRAKMPRGQGLWPAFWLLPATGAWPPEIDVVEVLGHKPEEIHQTAHWTTLGVKRDQGFHIRARDSSEAFHTYGVEWTPSTLRWFIDGRETARMRAPEQLRQPMYLLVNLAVGGHWPGEADPAVLPAKLEVDYIRVYEPATEPQTASAP